MQEEVENRTLTLVVSGTKFTGRLFKAAISKYMAHRREKKLEKQRSRDSPVTPKGKQTVKQLIGQNQGVSNIEINDPSIKDFERIARKYGVDYAVKKDRSASPPKYLIFFKARDADALTAAFSEYTQKKVKKADRKKSMHYNPFSYIHSEKDILKLVTTLIANTKGEGKAGDDFWVKAETLLYCALIGYIHYEAPVEEQNFSTLIEMINSMEVREDDEEFKNAVDLMFDELKERDPNHFAVRQYAKYKLAAGKTAKSILVSCGARLAVFDIAELREVTSYDELELDTLGDRRTALFLIMSDTDDSFNFLISMCYTQLFNLLCEKADDVYGGRLPVHVRCLIDECANIGQIPKLEKLVATIRSREISACLVLQAQSQLKAIYKDNADTIIGNMDSSIFLGGKEPTTLKELEAVLGKETIDTYNTGESRGRETSHSLNYQKLGKALMSQDELAVMDGGKCILQLRGVRPFLSDKYDITQHPNYKYTADADPKNAFDIEGYLKARLKLKPNQVCDVYEIDAAAGD